MIMIKKLATVFLFLCTIASSNVFAADSNQKLFVNLTSDELNRATMAIGISTEILTQKKIPVTIFLSVEGARIADKNIPEQRHANGKSLKEMLSGFMNKGGRVIMCVMCMKNVGGMKKDDVIKGIQFGGGISALFEEGTTVLTY